MRNLSSNKSRGLLDSTVPPRVLVVEDNAINQRFAQALLEEAGYDCDVVDNGRDALTAIDRRCYDAVLMDARMPEMDGYATTRAIRDREVTGRRLPIIGLTADVLAGGRQHALGAGMDGFLTKPICPQQLFDMLATHICQSTPRRSIETERLRAACDGQRWFARQLVGAFIADVHRHLIGLSAAAEAGEADLVRRRAHSVKGSAGNVGADGVAETALLLEQAAIDRDVPAMTDLSGRLAQELARAEQALKDYVATGDGLD